MSQRSFASGRQPIGVPRMLRMYCLQQWYGLADEPLEDALYDSQLWGWDRALRFIDGPDEVHLGVAKAELARIKQSTGATAPYYTLPMDPAQVS